jgi:hypothetical protein
MVNFVSANTLAKLDKEPHLILLDWLHDNWLTTADPDYPNLPLKNEIAFGYHWSERSRLGMNVTLRTRPEPEIAKHYLSPTLHDYNQRVWVDFYLRVIDTTFSGGLPQIPSAKLSVIKNFVRDIIETNPQGLQADGIHGQEYERFDEIPNPDESNVFHGICFVRLIYRLVGI